MFGTRRWWRAAAAAALIAGVVAPASATTLRRASLDELVAGNRNIVVGEVLDAQSYWNAEGTFILTDYRISAAETIKGLRRGEFTVTLMGGTVGDLTTLIVGGPELIPGKSYVLFLNEEQLPGVEKTLTVRDLSQGAFDLVMTGHGLRAVSQANGQPLVPDAKGYVDAPGGVEGFPYEAMIQSIREIADRDARGQREAQ